MLASLRGLRAIMAGMGGATVLRTMGWPRGITALRKDAVVESGGFHGDSPDVVGDMMVRMQAQLREHDREARVRVVADRLLVTRAAQPRTAMVAHHAVVDALRRHGPRLARAGGPALSTACMLALAAAGPALELLAYVGMFSLWALGKIPAVHLLAFITMAASLSLLVSATALCLEAAHVAGGKPARLWRLALVAAVEPLGARQWEDVTRLRGLWRALRRPATTG
jgi:hypothetical protein